MSCDRAERLGCDCAKCENSKILTCCTLHPTFICRGCKDKDIARLLQAKHRLHCPDFTPRKEEQANAAD